MTATLFSSRPLPRFPMGNSLSKPLALAAILVVIALSIGGALAGRMEQRAAQDRLSFGDVADS